MNEFEISNNIKFFEFVNLYNIIIMEPKLSKTDLIHKYAKYYYKSLQNGGGDVSKQSIYDVKLRDYGGQLMRMGIDLNQVHEIVQKGGDDDMNEKLQEILTLIDNKKNDLIKVNTDIVSDRTSLEDRLNQLKGKLNTLLTRYTSMITNNEKNIEHIKQQAVEDLRKSFDEQLRIRINKIEQLVEGQAKLEKTNEQLQAANEQLQAAIQQLEADKQALKTDKQELENAQTLLAQQIQNSIKEHEESVGKLQKELEQKTQELTTKLEQQQLQNQELHAAINSIKNELEGLNVNELLNGKDLSAISTRLEQVEQLIENKATEEGTIAEAEAETATDKNPDEPIAVAEEENQAPVAKASGILQYARKGLPPAEKKRQAAQAQAKSAAQAAPAEAQKKPIRPIRARPVPSKSSQNP